MRRQMINFLILTGTILLVFLSSLLLLTAATFFLNQPIGWYHLPAAALVTLIFSWFATEKYFPRQYDLFAVAVLCVVAIFTFSIRLSGSLYDFSVDGQTYHFEAIVSLINGWNPVQTAHEANTIYVNSLNFYSKGSWIVTAAIDKFLAAISPSNSTNPYQAIASTIEQSKAANALLIAASLCFAIAALLSMRRLKWRTAVLLGLLLGLNPVNISQIFTNYVDGSVAASLLILISIALLLYRRQNWVLFVAFIADTIITINLKLTCVVYVAVLGGGFVLWYCLTRRHRRVALVACLSIGCFLGGVFVGYNPYITQYTRNLIQHHDPFYPTSVAKLSDIQNQMPRNFTAMSPWERLLYSLLARPNQDVRAVSLKVPFTVTPEEFQQYSNATVRDAGLGPLFGSACIIALLVIGLLALQALRSRKRIRLVVALVPMLFLTLVSVLANPEAWWFRFAPQLWLIPIFVAVLAFSTSPSKHLYGLTYLLVALLLFNSIGTSYFSFSAVQQQQILVQNQMVTLRQISNSPGPLYVALNNFPATRYRLIANDVNFLEVKDLPCSPENQKRIYSSNALFCAPDPSTALGAK